MAGGSQAKGLVGDAERVPEPPFVERLRAIDRALGKVEEIAVTLILVGLVGAGVYQLVKTHWFPPAPFWPREIVKVCVLFIAMIAGAMATQSDRLFNIDMFTRLFKQRGKLVIRLLAAAFTIYICIMFVRGSVALREVLAGEEGEIISPQTAILAMPIGFGLIAVHLILHSVIDLYYLATGKPSPDVKDVVPKA